MKNQIISAKIAAHLAAGMTIQQAFDAVLGAGAYARVAREVYDALRAG